MTTNYHPSWQTNRVDFILEHYPADFFKGKRVLELAPYNGYIGYRFSLMGAQVHCIEGRQANVDNIRRTFPALSVEQADLDRPDWPWGKWDIIINFGLYYHLQNYHREHMVNCLQNCNLMFFETVVYDSSEPELFVRSESGDDQSLTDVGGNPSTSYVENILRENGATFTKYSTPKLNGNGHHYDWKDTNSKVLDPMARRFWIVSM